MTLPIYCIGCPPGPDSITWLRFIIAASMGAILYHVCAWVVQRLAARLSARRRPAPPPSSYHILDEDRAGRLRALDKDLRDLDFWRTKI